MHDHVLRKLKSTLLKLIDIRDEKQSGTFSFRATYYTIDYTLSFLNVKHGTSVIYCLFYEKNLITFIFSSFEQLVTDDKNEGFSFSLT